MPVEGRTRKVDDRTGLGPLSATSEAPHLAADMTTGSEALRAHSCVWVAAFRATHGHTPLYTTTGGTDLITTYVQTLRLISRDARMFLTSGALMGFNYFGVYNVLLNLYLLRLGYGPEFIGLVNAGAWLAYAGFSLPSAALAGRWGVRRMVIAGWCLIVVGLGLLPLADWVPDALRPAWLVATSAVGYAGAVAYFVNGVPFRMSATSEKERDHVFSLYSAFFRLGAFAGSVVAGLLPGLFAATLGVSLDQPAPYRYPLLIAVALLLPGIPVLQATRKDVAEPRQATVRGAGSLPVGPIALMTLIYLLRSAGEGVVGTFFNVYLDADLRVPTALIGTVMASGQILSALAALAAPLVMARWGKGHTVVLGLSGMAISLLPLALVPHWIVAGLGFVGFVGMISIVNPAFFIFSQQAVSPAWRPVLSGATMTAQGLSVSALALGGGYAIRALGYRSPFTIAMVLTAAGALLFWAFFLRAPREEPTRAPAGDGAE